MAPRRSLCWVAGHLEQCHIPVYGSVVTGSSRQSRRGKATLDKGEVINFGPDREESCYHLPKNCVIHLDYALRKRGLQQQQYLSNDCPARSGSGKPILQHPIGFLIQAELCTTGYASSAAQLLH